MKGDDLFIDPLQLIPPPMVEGRLVTVRVEDTLLVQEFARLPDDVARATVQAAWEVGIRHFDTAPFYGSGLSEHLAL